MKVIKTAAYIKTANVSNEELLQIKQEIEAKKEELRKAKMGIHSKNEIEKTDYVNYINSLEGSLRTLEGVYFQKQQQLQSSQSQPSQPSFRQFQ